MVAKFFFCGIGVHVKYKAEIIIFEIQLSLYRYSITYEKCVIPKYKTNLVCLGMTIHVFGLTEQER